MSHPPSELTIEVQGLKKCYGTFEAVRGIDVAVGRGEVVGFLGPNGAGKTTTVEIMEGFRSPTEGTVRVLGTDPVTGGRELRERIGIVLQEAGFLEELTVTETLDAWRRLFPDPLPTDEAIERVGLGSRASVRVKNLSGGEKRRLDFALGTVGRPEVLFLDEPTTGFDPSARRQAWELVRELVEEGTTVFLTTHYMEEAQALADRVAVIAAGVIVAEGSPDDLRGSEGTGIISFRLPAGVRPGDLPRLDGAEVTVDDERVSVRAGTLTEPLHRLTGWALGRGVELEGLSVVRPSLEDVYLDLVRERPEDGGVTTTATATTSDRAPLLPLVLAIIRLEQKSFWRNKQSAMFSFAMPLLFVLIFPNIIQGDAGGDVSYQSYFVAGMIGISLVSATYTTLAISVAFQRDLLTLKRLRGTPLTPLMIFGGKVASAAITVTIQVVIILSIGRLAYDIPLPRNWLAFVVIVLVGIAVFSLLGIGYTAFIPNADSAPAIVQLPYLVLQFISGVFFPFRLMPGWLQTVASIFPLRWLVDGIRAGYLGLDYLPGQAVNGDYTPERVSGLAALTSQWPGLLIMGLWGAAGLVVALRRFRWEKRRG